MSRRDRKQNKLNRMNHSHNASQREAQSLSLTQAEIINLSHDGRGIAKIDGKTVFIRGALPGEQVEFKYTNLHAKFDEGHVTTILTASPDRVTPPCPHAGICGGCNIQHMSSPAQILLKQNSMLEQLSHFGKQNGKDTELAPRELLPAMTGPTIHYRRKARLGVKYVAKKESVLVGFREADNGRFLTDIQECKVLDERVGTLITPLKTLLHALDARREIPQIEVAIGDNDVALIIRHLSALSREDIERVISFAKEHGLRIYLQPGNTESIHLLTPQDDRMMLSYALPEYGLNMQFHPADFTQVNAQINQQMVSRTIELLNLNASDRVLDLFCGLGNFTLAIAKRVNFVVGVEGDKRMVERARMNAESNNITNGDFHAADLTQDVSHFPWAKESYNKILIDPPRSGALEILPLIVKYKPELIVYVSCNPATLARDAGELVNTYGYTLQSAGVMDMFPHTSHVESIAVFIK